MIIVSIESSLAAIGATASTSSSPNPEPEPEPDPEPEPEPEPELEPEPEPDPDPGILPAYPKANRRQGPSIYCEKVLGPSTHTRQKEDSEKEARARKKKGACRRSVCVSAER